MNEELKELLRIASEKLSEAQEARMAVTDYLEEHYGITDISEYEYFEDECEWCYGLSESRIKRAIE